MNKQNLLKICYVACPDGFFRAAVFFGQIRITHVGRISFETDQAVAAITGGRRGLDYLVDALLEDARRLAATNAAIQNSVSHEVHK